MEEEEEDEEEAEEEEEEEEEDSDHHRSSKVSYCLFVIAMFCYKLDFDRGHESVLEALPSLMTLPMSTKMKRKMMRLKLMIRVSL